MGKGVGAKCGKEEIAQRGGWHRGYQKAKCESEVWLSRLLRLGCRGSLGYVH